MMTQEEIAEWEEEREEEKRRLLGLFPVTLTSEQQARAIEVLLALPAYIEQLMGYTPETYFGYDKEACVKLKAFLEELGLTWWGVINAEAAKEISR